MRAVARWCLRLFLFWVVFFLLQQIAFLALNADKLDGIPFGEVLAGFGHALPMHLSAAGYVMILPTVLAVALTWRDRSWPRRTIQVFLIALVVVAALVNAADIGLFQAWGTKVNRKALSYLVYPEEAAHATAGAPLGALVPLFAVECTIGIWWILRSRLVAPLPVSSGRWTGAFALFMPLVLVLAARGGPQDDPINKSWSYYSRHPVLNLGAVNGIWNLFEILVEPAEYTENPYTYLPKEEAHRIFDELHAPGRGPSEHIFTIDRPNIVLVLLESWSGDVIATLGGESDVTPRFTALCDEGLLFTQFYSTGFRTEQGLCAIFSGFPSQPKTTIIRKYGKFDRLPSLVAALDSIGYSSAWYHTGDVDFANMRSYLESMGVDVIHSEDDLPGTKRTEWGAYDEELFSYYLADTGSFRSPYFHVIMTATSHEPFDAPVDGGFPGRNKDQQYRNAAGYTDKCLGSFFDVARRTSDWDSTLYILVSDHGHFLPKGRNHFDAERHRIPCLLLGGALCVHLRGTRNTTLGSHVDLPATVLGQLGRPHARFPWSKDLFDPATCKFAFYTFDDGFGYIEPGQALIFDAVRDRPILWQNTASDGHTDTLMLRNGRALLQVELDRYMELDQ
jgi:glucan phosphoethanolaminetransferase (alkaline phosphatase superfamily)